MHTKVKTRQELGGVLDEIRREGRRIVFTNGCFDLLHIGHTRYLHEAKALGDILIVGLNSDDSVRSLAKGPGRPVIPESQRAEIVAALGCVDIVVVFHEPDPLMLIQTIQPHILVKGGDWNPDQIVGREMVETQGGCIRSIPLVPNISTTLLIQRIKNLP